jgi:uncharacterized protein (TIRG00374 family)
MSKEIVAIQDDIQGNGNGEMNPASLEKRFFNIRTVISFGVAFAILFFVFQKMNLDVGDIAGNIRTANPLLYLVALVTYYSTFIIRSLRWKLLLENVGFSKADGHKLPSVLGLAEVILLSWFANCIMPAKLGDAYRAYLLKHNAQVSFSKTFGTILAERIIDLLLTFVLLAVTGLVAFHGTLPPEIVAGAQGSIALVALAIIGLIAMRNLGTLIRRFIPERFHDYYERLEEGTLHSFRRMPLVLTFSVVAWMIESARLYLVVLSLGLTAISLPIVLLTAIAASLLTSIPGTPAGLGVVEGTIITILVLAGHLGLAPGMNEGLAATVAILDRTISYWSIVLFGLIAYLLTKKK